MAALWGLHSPEWTPFRSSGSKSSRNPHQRLAGDGGKPTPQTDTDLGEGDRVEGEGDRVVGGGSL